MRRRPALREMPYNLGEAGARGRHSREWQGEPGALGLGLQSPQFLMTAFSLVVSPPSSPGHLAQTCLQHAGGLR